MLVMIDNFDSFTYNLYQYLMQMGAEVRVARNNSLTVEELEALAPRGLVISPGPGRSWGSAWGTRPSRPPSAAG
jgi:anthranilate/para-aminobenzoate synthase component II